jgi:predicted enzyme related to lactoylglutathione lyase
MDSSPHATPSQVGEAFMKNSVAHFEIYAGDTDSLAKFYSTLFDWTMQPMPGMDYTYVEDRRHG